MLDDILLREHDKFENINILLERAKDYNPKGRMQTEEEAKEKDELIKKILIERQVSYVSYPGEGPGRAVEIADYVQKEIEKRSK